MSFQDVSNDMDVKRRQMWKDVDLFLEEFYAHGCEAGRKMQESEMGMAQVRGLESIIVSTRRFSEVINYIKNQSGKDTKSVKWKKIAGTLLTQLETLEKTAEELGGDNPEIVLEAKLKLVRGWGKQVISHYLFEKAKPQIMEGS